MTIVLVGAGRMGLRHLRGLAHTGSEVHVVDPRPEAETDVLAIAPNAVVYRSLEDAPAADAAILAEPAAGRLERLQLVLERGARRAIAEKPLEQSRDRVRRVVSLARERGADVRCNLNLRALPVLAELAPAGGPFEVQVTGGAWGLACNGIHWLDLLVHLGGGPGALLYGELDDEPVASPRGAGYRDYGGRALYGFPDGSRLYLASSASSSAPMLATVAQPSLLSLLDPHSGDAVVWERDPASSEPPFRYGAGYARRDLSGGAALDLPLLTAEWAGGSGLLPTVEEAVASHELLFDLLETTGEILFPVT